MWRKFPQSPPTTHGLVEMSHCCYLLPWPDPTALQMFGHQHGYCRLVANMLGLSGYIFLFYMVVCPFADLIGFCKDILD